MKKYLLATLIACSLISGCRSKTEYGKCVGIDDTQDPKLEYKLSVRNVVLGCFFVETVIVPVLVLVDETYCPVGNK